MKTLKFLTMAAFASFAFISCSDDDEGDVTGNDLSVNVYATSNTVGGVTAYKLEDDGDIETRTIVTGSLDTEGVYFDNSDDELVVVSRTGGNISIFDDVDDLDNNEVVTAVGSSIASTFPSARDIAVNGNIYVVSDNSNADDDEDDQDGRFFVFTRSGNDFTLRNTVTVDFSVWGIEFVGNTLYAVVDKTSDVAQFNNFAASNTTNATVAPTKRVTIEGIVRTHGIGHDGGTVILTDIGDAMSDIDGGYHVITDFEAKFNAVDDGGTLAVANNQIRVAGSSTFLGNPVAVDYDKETETVYIAERANSDGRILAYTEIMGGGNITPDVNILLAGASSVYFSED